MQRPSDPSMRRLRALGQEIPDLHVLAAWLSDITAGFSTNFPLAHDRLYSLFHDSISIRAPLTLPLAVAAPLAASAAPSGCNNPLAHCIEDDFGGIVESQFLHHVGAVCLDGVGTEVENRGRFLIRFSLRQELQDFAFPLRQ